MFYTTLSGDVHISNATLLKLQLWFWRRDPPKIYLWHAHNTPATINIVLCIQDFKIWARFCDFFNRFSSTDNIYGITVSQLCVSLSKCRVHQKLSWSTGNYLTYVFYSRLLAHKLKCLHPSDPRTNKHNQGCGGYKNYPTEKRAHILSCVCYCWWWTR